MKYIITLIFCCFLIPLNTFGAGYGGMEYEDFLDNETYDSIKRVLRSYGDGGVALRAFKGDDMTDEGVEQISVALVQLKAHALLSVFSDAIDKFSSADSKEDTPREYEFLKSVSSGESKEEASSIEKSFLTRFGYALDGVFADKHETLTGKTILGEKILDGLKKITGVYTTDLKDVTKVFTIDLTDVEEELANEKSSEYAKIKQCLWEKDWGNVYELKIPKSGQKLMKDLFVNQERTNKYPHELFPSLTSLSYEGDIEKGFLNDIKEHFLGYVSFMRDYAPMDARTMHHIANLKIIHEGKYSYDTLYNTDKRIKDFFPRVIHMRAGKRRVKGGLRFIVEGRRS